MEGTGIGIRIRELREAKDISMDLMIYDITHRFDVTLDKSMVSRWENGKNEPSLERAKALAEYFDVSLDYLIGLTDNKTPARLWAYQKALQKKGR